MFSERAVMAQIPSAVLFCSALHHVQRRKHEAGFANCLPAALRRWWKAIIGANNLHNVGSQTRGFHRMAQVELLNVTKIYQNGVRAVDAINLRVSDREFVVLVGPSGCGKST